MKSILLLLLLEDKLNEDVEDMKMNEFWKFCSENITMPEDIETKFNVIKVKYIQ